MAESTGGISSPYGSSGSATQEVTQKAQEKAQDVAGQAREQAQQLTGRASGRVRQEMDQRSTTAGEQISSTADDLRSVAEELRNKGKDTPARLAEQAAERVQQMGGYLQSADGDQILNDLEDFARRQPWAVVVGGIVLGFAASRFVKASSAERYQARGMEGDYTSVRSRAEIRSGRDVTVTGEPVYGGVAEGRSLDDDAALGTLPTDVPPAGPVVTGTGTTGDVLDDLGEDPLGPERPRNAGL